MSFSSVVKQVGASTYVNMSITLKSVPGINQLNNLVYLPLYMY